MGVEERQGVLGRGEAIAAVGEELAGAPQIAGREMVERDRHLNHPLQRLPYVARGVLPDDFEDLVHLEEEPRIPQGRRAYEGAVDGVGPSERMAAIGVRRGEGVRGVGADAGLVRGVHGEQGGRAALDEVHARQAFERRRVERGVVRGEPAERRACVVVVERIDGEPRERVAQWQRKHDVGRARAVCYTHDTVSLVYTATAGVRHHELDAWGRVYPAAHLRNLAELAVTASTAAGFGAPWYDALGAHWIVRRTTACFHGRVGRDDTCELRTWVADFRRVRSRRCYEIRVAGRPMVEAESDWVLVDVATGRPRRIPEEVERAFGAPSGADSAPRAPWDATVPPVSAQRTTAAVRFSDVDSIGHVNNAAYLDVLMDAALGPLARAGWGIARLGAAGLAPFVAACDVEYLEGAVWGESLEVTTWMVPASRGFEVVQHLGRAGAPSVLVRARTRWQWHATGGEVVDAPQDLAETLVALAAA